MRFAVKSLTVAVETGRLFAFPKVIGAQHQKNVAGRENPGNGYYVTSIATVFSAILLSDCFSCS